MTRPVIVLGVTVDISLGLMRGFPQYLVRKGWDVHIVSSPGRGLDALAQADGVTVHALRMERGPSPFRDLISLVRWIRLLRRIRPDVSSIGTPKAALLGGIAARLTRVPYRVYVLRGLRLETARPRMRAVLTQMEKLACWSAHCVLSVSESLRNAALGLGIVRPSKIVVLGRGSSNGVDTEAFEGSRFKESHINALRTELGLAPDVPTIGFVGRLTADKGLAVLAEARKILAVQAIDHQLLIVGGIDGGSAQESLRLVRNSGRAAVETGHVNNTAIYYQLIDILCLPTFREGFPNVVLEAGASGKPTVTTNATGAVDAVVDHISGIVVPVGDAHALANELKVLIGDSELRATLGTAAQKYVKQNFQQSDVWAMSEALYAGGPKHDG